MENVADPAHVPVAHHGLVGDRYRDAKYYDMPRVRELSTQEGFAFAITPTAPTIQRATHDFQPPCLMRIETTFQDGGALILVLYATPTRPGWCRHIGRQVLIKNNAGKTPAGLAFFALPMPTWLGHVLASLFLHQDLVFLHYQEKRMAARPGRWLEQVYTPNPQDKMVITFRQWLENRAGGGIPWSDTTDRAVPDIPLFDVWHTHTQHCHTCQKALKRINFLATSAWISAGLCVFLALWLDARLAAVHQATAMAVGWVPSFVGLGLLGMAVFLGLSGYFLKKLSRLFYVYEFHHADND
jgi:phenylpropionate dioxygenase-like ring-hydroxylating dioxygenase large terminal subunit